MMEHNQKKYVLSVDIGTTNLRCHIYNNLAQKIGESLSSIELVYPRQGWCEIIPDDLWNAFVSCIKNAIKNAHIRTDEISCIGICTLRGVFVTWDRETHEPFHNFITWNDIRSDSLCSQWNNSFRLKCLKTGAKFLHFFTRSKRFLAASLLKYTTAMTAMRLVWVLDNIPFVRQRAIEGKALFGTVDTYLVWRLTGGDVHATDPSNECISGIFDPFLMKRAQWAIDMFNIPSSMLPMVLDTNGNFGETVPSIFGCSIPIRAVVGDQSAAVFGECCFKTGDVKCTLGTGTFIDINTGTSPHASFKGLYPIVGWKLVDSKPIYLAEGGSYDTGTAIVWAQKMGLFNDPKDSSDIAKSVMNSGGLYFVPAFNGLQAPVNDNQAVAAFIGLNPNTTKAHMVRAILESLAFRVKQMYEIILEEADFDINYFRVNGGVANNDFLLQLISDLTGKDVERAHNRDMSSLGTAFLLGLSTGIWKNENEISQFRSTEKVFRPNNTWTHHYRDVVTNWERAVERCLLWHGVNSDSN